MTEVPTLLLYLIGLMFAGVLALAFGILALAFKSMGAMSALAQLLAKYGPAAHEPTPTVPSAVPTPSTSKPPPAPTAAPPISTQPVDIVDQGLVNFIKKAEGFTAKAKWDYKQYSIGYGTKATSANEVITEAEAEARLTVEIAKAYALVKPIIPAGTPVGIVQALVDLTYNAGPGWETQSLGAAVKAAKWDTVKADILQYNHAGGVVNDVLTKRREAEVSWFDNPL
jgi:GH24 family phage-related lysozyme (muramidase)